MADGRRQTAGGGRVRLGHGKAASPWGCATGCCVPLPCSLERRARRGHAMPGHSVSRGAGASVAFRRGGEALGQQQEAAAVVDAGAGLGIESLARLFGEQLRLRRVAQRQTTQP